MNNSSIRLEQEPSQSELSEERLLKIGEHEAKTVRVLEAIGKVQETEAWSTLKREVFDKLANSLERDLQEEAKKEDPDPKRLNRLAGELKWAGRYADLSKLGESFRLELQRIRTHKNAE